MNTDSDNILQNKEKLKPIFSITPFTLLDYPDKTACILWFAGCNMRCGYCYNPEIVSGKGKTSFGEVLSFLAKRKSLLDGVVFSGGECTLHKEILWLAEKIKNLGMSVKVDTNGSKPEVIRKMITENLIDYVALDFKAMPNSYEKITRSQLFVSFKRSLEVLLEENIPFEVRTTVHSELHSEADILDMVDFLANKGYTGHYYLQHFFGEKTTIEALPQSTKRKILRDYSVPGINVVWRN